jgi:hypothetical protein
MTLNISLFLKFWPLGMDRKALSHNLTRIRQEQARQFAVICERLDTLEKCIKDTRPLGVSTKAYYIRQNGEPYTDFIEGQQSPDTLISTSPEREEPRTATQSKTVAVKPNIMLCRWGTCNVIFSQQEEFLSHIDSHTPTWRCLWRDCGLDISAGDARDHLYEKHRTYSANGHIVCRWDNCEDREKTMCQDMTKFFKHWSTAHRKSWRTQCPWRNCELTFLHPNKVSTHCKYKHWRCQKNVRTDNGNEIRRRRSRKGNKTEGGDVTNMIPQNII